MFLLDAINLGLHVRVPALKSGRRVHPPADQDDALAAELAGAREHGQYTAAGLSSRSERFFALVGRPADRRAASNVITIYIVL